MLALTARIKLKLFINQNAGERELPYGGRRCLLSVYCDAVFAALNDAIVPFTEHVWLVVSTRRARHVG